MSNAKTRTGRGRAHYLERSVGAWNGAFSRLGQNTRGR